LLYPKPGDVVRSFLLFTVGLPDSAKRLDAVLGSERETTLPGGDGCPLIGSGEEL
jgi:hypothetical protein